MAAYGSSYPPITEEELKSLFTSITFEALKTQNKDDLKKMLEHLKDVEKVISIKLHYLEHGTYNKETG